MVIDTSVLIRYFTDDDPVKAEKFRDFLRTKHPFAIPDTVFSEVYWTLLTFYKLPQEQVIVALESMLGFPSVSCNYQLISLTITLVKRYNGLSFVDAYIASYSTLHNDAIVLSYDKGFSQIEGITRKEP